MFLLCLVFSCVSSAFAVETIIVGDIKYKAVADIVAQIKSSLNAPVKVIATDEAIGRLESFVEREDARLVVALGVNAVDEALKLPPSIPVIYGLIIAPPKTSRENVTGVYMSTPVNEYVNLISEHLPSLKQLSVVGTEDLARILGNKTDRQVAVHTVSTSSELLNAVDHLQASQALLLLPDVALLTPAVMEKVYLFSFRRKVPVLGISEGNVKQGALFAIVFDPLHIGEEIGEKALKVLSGVPLKKIPHSAPKAFNLFLNNATAKKMGISIPAEMMEKAKKVYL